MRATLPVLALCLAACSEPGAAQGTKEAPPHQAAPTPLSGRILDNGRVTFGEVLRRRVAASGTVRTAVIYHAGGQADPVTGGTLAVIVSGVEAECGARRMRYLYHEGYDADGAQLYRIEIPARLGWNTGERIAREVDALCAVAGASGRPDFENVREFLARLENSSEPVPVVVETRSPG